MSKRDQRLSLEVSKRAWQSSEIDRLTILKCWWNSTFSKSYLTYIVPIHCLPRYHWSRNRSNKGKCNKSSNFQPTSHFVFKTFEFFLSPKEMNQRIKIIQVNVVKIQVLCNSDSVVSSWLPSLACRWAE